MNNSLKMGRTEWLLLLLLAGLWGSSFLFMKLAVQTMPVFTVVLGRIGIAGLFMVAYVYATGQKLPTNWRNWGQLTLLGILRAALPITLFVWAGTQIDSNVSGILNSTTPLFTIIVAHIFTVDEKLNATKIVGVLLGMVGVVFLIGPNAIQGLGENVLGQFAVLGATCAYGFAGVYGRRFKKMPASVSTAGLLIVSTFIILPIALIVDQPWSLQPSTASIGSVLALAIFNTAIAFMVWMTLLLRAGATNTAQVTFIIPVMSILLGFLVLGERPDWTVYIGLLFILLGLAVAQNRLGQKLA